MIKCYKSEKNDVFGNTINYTLNEISILCLLVYFNLSIADNRIILMEPKSQKDEMLIDLLVNRNSTIEKSIYDIVLFFNDSLTNHYREPSITQNDLKKNKTTLLDLLFLIRRIKKKLRIKTRKSRYERTIYNSFELKRRMFKNIRVSTSLINKNPFSDTFNNFDKKGKLQYESKKEDVFNIIISDKRFDTLYSRMKEGKLFGYNFSWHYYNKGMFWWDLFFSIIFGIAFVILFTIKTKTGTICEGLLAWAKKIAWIPSCFFILKSFNELKYLIKGFDLFSSITKRK